MSNIQARALSCYLKGSKPKLDSHDQHALDKAAGDITIPTKYGGLHAALYKSAGDITLVGTLQEKDKATTSSVESHDEASQLAVASQRLNKRVSIDAAQLFSTDDLDPGSYTELYVIASVATHPLSVSSWDGTVGTQRMMLEAQWTAAVPGTRFRSYDGSGSRVCGTITKHETFVSSSWYAKKIQIVRRSSWYVTHAFRGSG